MRDFQSVKEELDVIYQDRDKYFPVRDRENTILKNQKEEELVNIIISNAKNYNINENNELITNAKNFLNNPVFICGAMKSGTTLSLELLDSHRNIIALPGDGHFIELLKKTENLKYSEKVNYWVNYWLKRMINPTGQYPFWLLGENINNYIDFYRKFLFFAEKQPLDLFKAVVFSYYYANNKHVDTPQLWVEKTPGNELNIDYLKSIYPNAKFIHVLRNPIINLSSLKKLSKLRQRKWSFIYNIYYLKKQYYIKNKMLKNDKDNYLPIFYEDILTKPKEITQTLAKFLGINWEDILLKPTINSIFAKSNSTDKNNKITGTISDYNLKNYKLALSKVELLIAKIVF